MSLPMSLSVEKTIEASASNINLELEDQQSSLKVNLSYELSLTDSRNDLKKIELLNIVGPNVIENNKASSVIICPTVKSLYKKHELSICSGVKEKKGKTNLQSTARTSEIVQQGVTKAVSNDANKSDIETSSQSVKTLHVNDMQSKLISQSTNFVSCSNSEDITPKNARNTISSILTYNKVQPKKNKLLRLQRKYQDPSDLNNCYINLIERNDNELSNPSSLISKKEYETDTSPNKDNVEQEYPFMTEDSQHFSISHPLMSSTFIESSNKHLENNQQLINDAHNKSTTYIKSATLNLSVPMDLTSIHNTRQIHDNYRSEIIFNKVCNEQNDRVQTVRSSEESMKTVRTSLNVNTSFDFINKENDVVTINEDSVTVQDVQNVLCPIDMSMRVNTSLDNVCQILPVENVKKVALIEQQTTKDKNATEIDSYLKHGISTMSEINLMKQFRNIASKEQKYVSVKPTINSEAKQQGLNSNIEILNGSRNSPGIVQGTPYPISRSVLLKSYFKFNTMMSISNSGLSTHLCDSGTRNKIHITVNTDVLNSAKDKTVLVPEHTSGTQIAVSNDHAKQARSNVSLDGSTLITAEVSKAFDKPDNNNGAGATINNSKDAPKVVIAIKGKKKLMPLKDDSELFSFTPVDVEPLSPKLSQPFQKHRNRKKNLIKKTSAKNVLKKKISVNEDPRKTILNAPLFDTNRLKTRKMEPRKQRRVLSKKIVAKKHPAEYLLPKFGEYDSVRKNQMELSRRVSSLDEFESCKTIPVHMRKYKSQDIFIVATGLSKGDKHFLKKAVNTLGNAKIELRVTNRTTHVVTAGGRTINLLHGIIRGCWLINLDWVTHSLQNNRWLNPIKYEIREFSKAVSENRKDRQMFGPSYVSDIFTTCGFVYIENNTVPPCEVLKELITSAGGRITEDSKKAKIVIGKSGLKESWVLDCITNGEIQSFTKYQRA